MHNRQHLYNFSNFVIQKSCSYLLSVWKKGQKNIILLNIVFLDLAILRRQCVHPRPIRSSVHCATFEQPEKLRYCVEQTSVQRHEEHIWMKLNWVQYELCLKYLANLISYTIFICLFLFSQYLLFYSKLFRLRLTKYWNSK